MPVRLLKPYNGQNAGTVYVGTNEDALRAIGIADDYYELATNYVGVTSQAFRAYASTFSTVAPAGSFVATLTNPFAGQGRGITTYATQGTVPPQLALSPTGRSLVIGGTPGVDGTVYTITLVATSGDGLLTTQPVTLNFKAVAQASYSPTPSPTPGSFEGFKATGSWTGSDARVVTGTTGMASVVCIQMDQPFTEVQLDFFNPDITAPSQMDSVEVFTSASAANAVPTGSPVTLTFGGVAATSAAPIMVPAGTQGAATTGTPASDQVLANRQPGHLASDSVPLVSVPRTDGGAGYLLYIRVRTAGAFAITNTSSQFAANYATGWMGISGGRDFKNWTLVGSSTWATRPNASDALTAAHLCVAARTKTTARALNVLSIGDSIRQGFATNTGFNSALRNAKRLNTAITPIAVINAAIASSQSASMVVNAKKWIDFFKPDVVLVPAFTGNDMPSATPVDQALLDASYARAMEVVTYAQAAGAKVIIDLPIPYSRFTAATEPLITAYRQRWKTAGFTCFDAYDALGNGATPQAIQSQYSADNVHPNDAGHAVGGGILLPLLNAEMVARGMPFSGGTGSPANPSVFANGVWNDTATWNDADIWKDAA